MIRLDSLAATEKLAARLAPLLRPGDAVLLEGPLGAGKTAFARGVLRAACGDAELEVPSPSYTLVQSYEAGGATFHHFDLWRMAGPEALAELGWDEARRDIVLVEWPDRLGAYAPAQALTISFRLAGETAREMSLAGWPRERIARLAYPDVELEPQLPG
jgi:tRNA threonylcarbamoyladenosine biosynthesis protein TsaE